MILSFMTMVRARLADFLEKLRFFEVKVATRII
jgi:hypothetical protein